MRYSCAIFGIIFACPLITGCAQTQPTVTQFGQMRAVMREGHTEPRINLQAAVQQPHAIAVGALEGLAGEVTIIDGQVWVARVNNAEVETTGPDPRAQESATLLTIAYVDNWHSVPVGDSIDAAGLESLIEQTARAQGIDTTKPFPFKIEGQLDTLDLHVINGYCPIATDPATVDAQPGRISITEQSNAVLVGFYASDQAGIMTHHGTSIHAHAIVKTNNQTLSGHVDHVIVGSGMILSVPGI